MSSSETLVRSAAVAVAVVLMAAACTGSEPDTAAVDHATPRATAASPEGAREGSGCRQLPAAILRAKRGWVPGRSADIVPIPREATYIGGPVVPVHTGPWDYLSRVPLVAYGPGSIERAGRIGVAATMADVAPTIARLIGYDGFSTSDGRVLDEAIADDARRPRLVVTIVWDGAGWNVLRRHPDRWPFMRRLMDKGTTFTSFDIGSHPSNTPPVHTTLGTGVFPATHGIPNVTMRTPEDVLIDPFEGNNAIRVRVPTLADLYDRSRNNRPEIGLVGTVPWHLGMIGRGRMFPRGDADVAALLNDRGISFGDDATYDVPVIRSTGRFEQHVRRLDRDDGSLDGLWGTENLADLVVRYRSPAYIPFQQEVLEDVIAQYRFGRDGTPDLMFVNFKQIDGTGHGWGMSSEQVGQAIEAADAALRRLVRFLDERVGRNRWTLFVTADHGQTPFPRQSGLWPIAAGELKSDIQAEFDDVEGDELVARVTAAGIFLDRTEAAALGVGADEIGRWLIDYTARDDVPDGAEIPAPWRNDPEQQLFAAVLAGRRVVARSC